MVYKFRLLSDEKKDFIRDIEILADQTFFDFHKMIQDDLGYDSSQIASFFTTNKDWEKEKEFTLFDMADEENSLTVLMDKAKLKNYITKSRQRLIYIFDIFNERSFFIELTDIQENTPYSDYPAVVFSKGNPPPQILFSSNNYGSFGDNELMEGNFNDDQDSFREFEDDTSGYFDDDLPFEDNEEDQDTDSDE